MMSPKWSVWFFQIIIGCGILTYAANTLWCYGKDAKLKVNISNVDEYYITFNDTNWFLGNSPNIWCDGEWHSTTDSSLQPLSSIAKEINGTNVELGSYVGLEMHYKIKSQTNSSSACQNQIFEIQFLYFNQYDVFMFKQIYPLGLSNTPIIQYKKGASYQVMVPITEFPVFKYNDNSFLKTKMAFMEWQGVWTTNNFNYNVGLSSFIGGNWGGITLFYENGKKKGNSIVISAASNLMNGIQNIRTRRESNSIENITLYNNTDFTQYDLKSFSNISSLNHCVNLCKTHLFCNCFSYNKNNNVCYLKYNGRGKTHRQGHISGTIGNDINGDLDNFVMGIEGNITNVPSNYSISFIISASSGQGIHGSIEKYGKIMKKLYHTNKITKNDIIVNYLGYWTDNGAFYSGHNNGFNTSVATQLFDALNYNKIPIQYLQLDPWWYSGGSNTEKPKAWIAREDLFGSGGLFDLYQNIGKIKLLLYSNWWQGHNQTQQFYNDNYNLDVTFMNGEENMAVPEGYDNSYKFYKFILSQYLNITIGTEIDFMNKEYDAFSYFIEGYDNMLNYSSQWLQGMNDGNLCFNVSVQFCMSLPNQILDSLQFNAVTNARAGTDNNPNNLNRWWRLPYSALLFHAIDLRAFNDVLWTISIQPGNWYNCTNFDVDLQSIITILSNGPFGIGDNVNMTNKTIIHRICRSDGLLLHPSAALTPIDSIYFNMNNTNHEKQIYFTYTEMENIGITSYVIITVDYFEGYNITFDDLYPYPDDNYNYIVYHFDDSNLDKNGPCKNGTLLKQCGALTIFNKDTPLIVETNNIPTNNMDHLHSWSLYNVIKVQSNGWTLIGDMTRYVSLSNQRFKNIETTNNGLKIVVQGCVNESFSIVFITNQSKILQIPLSFHQNEKTKTIVVP